MIRCVIGISVQTVVFSFFLFCISDAFAEGHCSNPVARLVSVQGDAQFRQAQQTGWLTVALNDEFCAGDVLRIGVGGRAAVVLNNESILRIDQNSVLNFSDVEEEFSLLNLLKGVLHIFSHRPRSLKVSTPYINGSVEGTEFLVSTDDASSFISVFEGMVIAANEFGRLELGSGQAATVQKGAAPVYTAVVSPRDAVQWTLYYPVIVGDKDAGNSTDPGLVADAADFLSVGRVEEAGGILGKALDQNPQNGDALALLSVIAVVQNNNDQALELARKAMSAAPDSAPAALALSYARQAIFDLDGALEVLTEAARKNPGNSQVLARLAEMQLGVGQFEDGLVSAHKALELMPENGRALAVLGFAHLASVEIEEASAAFSQAIQMDPALPLARLGYGLSLIRGGDLTAGRSEIEIAAALDPGNSMIRSYLGKAYFDEKRDGLASRQYTIARELDGADPTPWFYEAILKQTQNQPVDALQALHESIARNDNRAVYRSSFMLDDDLASRSASLGRIYEDLGFEQLALAEGWKSVTAQPGNYSAHRLLADSYQKLPRHEIARVSQLLQSQLLQPLNINPVQPHLAESDLAILEGAGPSQAAYNEYAPLYLRNRFALQASGVVGSNNILGDELVHSAVVDKFSYSVGQFYYETDGIRENNDQQKAIYNVYFQGMVSPRTSWMLEGRYRDNDTGDLNFQFDPTEYQPTLRQSGEEKSLRAGIRHDFKPHSTLIGTAVIGTLDDEVTGIQELGTSIDISSSSDNFVGELQHIYNGGTFNLQSGVGYLNSEATDTVSLAFPFPMDDETDTSTKHANLYSYAQIPLPYDFTATLGLSGDLLEDEVKDREELNPKLGLTWQATDATLIRAAAFKRVQRNFFYDQTIEPTHVAGFNQFFDDTAATLSWVYGFGLDHTFSRSLYGGAQLFHRDLDVPFLSLNFDGSSEVLEDDWDEDVGSAYLYWTPASWTSFGFEYYYEQFSHGENQGPQGIKELTTHRFSPRVNFFHGSGLTAKIQANYIDQKGEFGDYLFGYTEGSDQFWLVDLAISYRLPKRYGIISLGVKNLFDEEFNYVDTDPLNPRYQQEQQVMLSLTVTL